MGFEARPDLKPLYDTVLIGDCLEQMVKVPAASVDLMRHCSLTKWAACGVTLVLFWWIFLPSRRGSALYRLLALSIAAFSLISGSMAILGMWDITKIELFPFFALALLLQIPLFCSYWADVDGSHAPVEGQPIEKWEVNPANSGDERKKIKISSKPGFQSC